MSTLPGKRIKLLLECNDKILRRRYVYRINVDCYMRQSMNILLSLNVSLS